MISARAAWRLLEPALEPLAPTRVPRGRALGRVLASGVEGRVDVPAADVSAMDGYAVGGAVRPGEARPVAGVVAAGDAPGAELPAGAALRIMTGAPVPAGADRVVPVELTDGGRERVVFHDDGGGRHHIRKRGEIHRRGGALLAAGDVLTPGALALLASHGYGEVAVHGAPRVALLVTGDEVVPADAEPAAGQLRDSHTDFLLAAGATLGLSFAPLGISPDSRDELAKRIEGGLDADVLLVTGGVSMGEFDFVEEVLGRFGCEVLFDAVAIQPGKPLVAARQPGGALVFGLPGNPASAAVCFWLFVMPALRRLQGHEDAFWRGALRGELAAPLPAAKARDRFLPAQLAARHGRLLVTPYPPKGSHDLAAYARGNALVRVPAGAERADAGSVCEALPIAMP